MKTTVRATCIGALVGICAWVAACTDVCGCPPLPASALVYGRVIDEAGTLMPGAAVTAYSAPSTGCQAAEEVDLGFSSSRSDGTFRMALAQGGEQENVCVFTFARPPESAANLIPSDTALLVLGIRYAAPQDSAAIELVLRER